MVRSACKPAVPKNTGMKKAMISPRSCSSMCLVRIGDSPTRMPATNAPSTVCTPIRSVTIAMPPMISRMAVITAKSLMKVSLTQRMMKNTSRRPTVRLSPMNTSVPMTLLATLKASMWPCSASEKITAVIIQPTVSSMMAEARITWPTRRRMKFISRITVATIFTEAIDSAVPRNSDVISRFAGSGSMASGSASPSATPHRNGTTMPAMEAENEARPLSRTSLRSVSMPVSSSSTRMPNCATASSIAFCSLAAGNRACWKSGKRAPSSEGPSTRPAINWPITAGCPKRSMTSPSRRPTSISTMSWATKTSSEGPWASPVAARAAAGRATAAAAIQGQRGRVLLMTLALASAFRVDFRMSGPLSVPRKMHQSAAIG